MLATRRRTLDERGPGHTVRVERVGRAAPKTVRLEARRGLTVGLAVGGYGAGSAIFGPLAQLKLIPAYGLPSTFRILAALFFVMTTVGALLLRNPPAGYKPAGWPPLCPRWRSRISHPPKCSAPALSTSCGSHMRSAPPQD